MQGCSIMNRTIRTRQRGLSFALAVLVATGASSVDVDAEMISKAVDKDFAGPGETLNYSVNLDYSGSELLLDANVRDFVPVGTTYTSAGQGGSLETFSSQSGIDGVAPSAVTPSRGCTPCGGADRRPRSGPTTLPVTHGIPPCRMRPAPSPPAGR